MNPKAILTATIVASSIAGAYAQSKKEAVKPNILFILADQWRRQAVGYAAEDKVYTPNLDRVSRDAVVFTHATAAVPVSGPNRGCIFTGKYVINHGIWGNGAGLQDYEPTSLGKLCKDAGYKTAYIGKWHMNGSEDRVRGENRRQGFDYWVQSKNIQPFRQPYYPQDPSVEKPEYVEGWAPSYETDKAIEFIEQNRAHPFCVVVSWGPPHTGGGKGFEGRHQPGKKFKTGYGYAAPERFEALYNQTDYEKDLLRPNVMPTGKYPESDSYAPAVPGYLGAVSALDDDFGRLVEYLEKSGLAENTIVVFTSDHGEMMGSHGRMTKGLWFEESVGVPCLIRWKGNLKAREITDVFNSIDLVPTLMGLIGESAPPQCDGTDYSPLLRGRKFDAPQYAFLEFNYGGVPEAKNPRFWRAVYTPRYTYTLCGMNNNRSFTKDGLVLYDKEKDPYQLNPIYRGMGYDGIIDQMHAVLTRHLEEIGDPFLSDYWNNQDWTGAPKLNVTPVY